MLSYIFLLTLINCALCFTGNSNSSEEIETCLPHSARVNCSYLPLEFLNCAELEELDVNKSSSNQYGCSKFGGQRYEEVEFGTTLCRVLEGIECCGEREFIKGGLPCIKYNGHYFVTTLIYSILLGFLGIDRFCLGHTGTAVGKLLSLGGLGIWWIADIIQLVTGSLTPRDGSNWSPNV